jgi:hypothetical protein
MKRGLIVAAVTLLAAVEVAAQTTVPKKPAARPAQSARSVAPRRVTESPELTCPNILGIGAGSQLQFCDVLTGRNPADGVLIHLPPHRGVLTLTFDLHNRHTYSEELVKAGKAYANYTATIGALTMDGTLLSRAVVRSEFRTARDLLDRIGGGAGPRGLKAVAPLGNERISIDVPENVDEISLLGEKLTVVGRNGTETFTAAQRPIATVSNLVIDYQPKPRPPAKPAAKPPIRKK